MKNKQKSANQLYHTYYYLKNTKIKRCKECIAKIEKDMNLLLKERHKLITSLDISKPEKHYKDSDKIEKIMFKLRKMQNKINYKYMKISEAEKEIEEFEEFQKSKTNN